MSEDITTCADNFRIGSQVVEMQGHRILVLSGEIDVYSSPQFKQAIISILDGDEQHLIIDMQEVTYMDSTGLSILTSVVKRISPNGRTVNLVGCKPHIERVLHITKISTFIALHQNTEDALKAIST